MIALREKTIEALGTNITLRELTIGQTLELNKLEPEDLLFEALSLSILKPKFTSESLRGLPSKYINEVIELSNTFIDDES